MSDARSVMRYTHNMDVGFLQFALNQLSTPVIAIDRERSIRFVNNAARTRLPEVDAKSSSGSLGAVGTVLTEVCGSGSETELNAALQAAFAGGGEQVVESCLFQDRIHSTVIRCVPYGEPETELVILIASAPSEDSPRASHDVDPVTGLMSRRMLPLVTRQEINRSSRARPVMAMLFIMLRDFKQINQMHGHQIGDLLLENTGVRVRDTVRTSDYVFRWEGTNMVVLLPELATRLDAAVVAEKIYSAVTVPYRFRDLDLAPGCHIGISIYPDDKPDPDGLFNAANSAVIEAERSEEPYRYFDEATHQQASDRLTLKTGLQRAFEHNELELYFQPIVDRSGTMRGAEALMRWNHPTRGLLGPASFIEIAEDTRLIVPIDTLALYHACRLLVDWNDDPSFFVTLNISAINLSDGTLPVVVSQAINQTGLSDPSRLKLELTESRTIENSARSLTTMQELGEMGVDIWIDDFGTGQSSLSYLKHLPASTVKIDKDFVADLTAHDSDIAYLSGIVNTVRSRGKRVVIEGISSEVQYRLVQELPVDLLQGFHFDRPMPRAELETRLRSRARG